MAVDSLNYALPDRALLDDVTLHVSYGESVAVTGASGSGKSTLLMCLLGLTKPHTGTVRIAGRDIVPMRGRALAQHRRANVGMVFQFGELLAELTPLENVALAGLLAGLPHREAYERARRLLQELGVPADGSPTAHLSGGERQRTAVARALVNEPALLLADEPTGALDSVNRETVADLLFSLPERRRCALLVVTHDASVAARADRTLLLEAGRLQNPVSAS
ncbi:ABC transporter ATP-binding protein [Streptomyces sp. NPDC056987]|uniref:ABC transporter ATP-binding protein n=1 Tax=Streptomyces sp. NPDC056987 TaxID=3345988 RepID=UPI00363DC7BD